MNKAIFMGRLVSDPEVWNSEDDDKMCIAKFRLAVDRPYTKKTDSVSADFFSCTAFRQKAEFVEKYLKSGIKVLVIGRLQNSNYENRNGEKVYSTNLIVEEIEFAESKKANGREEGNEHKNGEERRGNPRKDTEREDTGNGWSEGTRRESRAGGQHRRNEGRAEKEYRREDEKRGSSRYEESRPAARNARNVDAEFMNMDELDYGDLFA